jgi:hypothetical protein
MKAAPGIAIIAGMLLLTGAAVVASKLFGWEILSNGWFITIVIGLPTMLALEMLWERRKPEDKDQI